MPYMLGGRAYASSPESRGRPVRATILIVTLLMSALMQASAPAPANVQALRVPHAQAELLDLAARHPDRPVRVIVQKAGKGATVESRVSQLCGTITGELGIINAFTAELPAASAVSLSRLEGVRWVSLDAPLQSSSTVFLTWSTKSGTTVPTSFTGAQAIAESPQGPDGIYGFGGNARGAFGGFTAEAVPGTSITRVEAVLRLYVSERLNSGEDMYLWITVGGTSGSVVRVPAETLNAYTGTAGAGTVYIDMTATRPWRWADFDNELELVIDQSAFGGSHLVYYDAVGLRITADVGNDTTGGTDPTSLPRGWIDTARLQNAYDFAIRATDVWNEGPAYLQGQGVTVAVVDSGIAKNRDLDRRIIANVNFNRNYHNSNDRYGHGTFIAGVIAGSGADSNGARIGVAPRTNLINVRVSDDQGMATEADLVAGLQWVLAHKTRYNIRVVNLSLNSSMAQSYHTSPLDAAVEILWFNGIVVVASAGNNGTGTLYPPANDPFVITVGATNDMGTPGIRDDVIAGFSAYGLAETGSVKPDLVAPGTGIVAYLPDNSHTTISQDHPANRVSNHYFRMSGTSLAAPMVSGAVALLLQDEPSLTPDQVKYRLKATAVNNPLIWPGYDPLRAGAGYLDVYAAVHGTGTENANTATRASQLLWTGVQPVNWGSVNWNSINWNSVNWNSVNWNSVNWNSVNWNSDYWGP